MIAIDRYFIALHQGWVDSLAKRGFIQHDVARASVALHGACLVMMILVFEFMAAHSGSSLSTGMENISRMAMAVCLLLIPVRWKRLARLKREWTSAVARGRTPANPLPGLWTMSASARTLAAFCGTINVVLSIQLAFLLAYLVNPLVSLSIVMAFSTVLSYVSSVWFELCQPRTPTPRERRAPLLWSMQGSAT